MVGEKRINFLCFFCSYVEVRTRRSLRARSPFVDDFASSKRLEHAALEQIVFGPLAGLSDGRRLAPCSFVFEMCAARAAGAQSCRHIGVL
jgi:hypothetical protein